MALDEDIREAFIEFINLFDFLNKKCRRIEELQDGVILFQIANNLDPVWFRMNRLDKNPNDWPARYSNLLNLNNLVVKYYDAHLGKTAVYNSNLNMNSIAKDGNLKELTAFAKLVLFLYIWTHDPIINSFASKLTLKSQTVMMELMTENNNQLEQINAQEELASKSPSEKRAQRSSMSVHQNELQDKLNNLQKAHEDLMSAYNQSQEAIEELKLEKNDLSSRLRGLDLSGGQGAQTGKMETALRHEVDQIRLELEHSETQRHELESQLQVQQLTCQELSYQVDQMRETVEGVPQLHDLQRENKVLSEKIAKAENTLDKYKRKLEEIGELKRHNKVLEEQVYELTQKNSQLEDDYRRVNSFKSLMESYREKVSELESKGAVLETQLAKAEFEKKSLNDRNRALELECSQVQSQMSNLEEKLRDLELGSVSSPSEMTGEGSGQTFDEAQIIELKAKIVRLEMELSSLKEGTRDSNANHQLAVMKNWLDEMTKSKDDIEAKYLKAHQNNLMLESELERLRQSQEDPKGGYDLSLGLRIRLNQNEQELSELKLKLVDTEFQLQQSKKDLLAVKANPDIINNGSSDATDGTNTQVKEINEKAQSDNQELIKQIHELNEKHTQQIQQINQLLMDKDRLQSENIQNKDTLLEKERMMSELKSTLSTLESKDSKEGSSDQDTATLKNQLLSESQRNVKNQETITELNNKIKSLQGKVQKAKHHLQKQADHIKVTEGSVESQEQASELVLLLQSQLSEQGEQLEKYQSQMKELRAQQQMESRIIMSSWYEMALKIQRDPIGANVVSNRTGPTSWIAQQRNMLSAQLKRR